MRTKDLYIVWVVSFLVLITAASSSKTYAWGEEGHRIVARIAEARLTQTARQKINNQNLLTNIGCQNASNLADRFACASTWADDVRYEDTEHPESYNWHFVDISLQNTNYDHDRDCDENDPRGDCGIPALQNLIAVLKNQNTNPKYAQYSRKKALMFIIHIVGDLHQPLHTVKEHLGGNFLFVKYANSNQKVPCFSNTNTREKLHKIWDSCILSQMPEANSLIQYAQGLNGEITAQDKTSYESGSATGWLLDAHRLAIDNAYREIPTPTGSGINFRSTIPVNYYRDNEIIVETQFKRAGIRLAKILNESFSN